MRATLKIWTDAKSKVAAERILERAVQQLGFMLLDSTTEFYPKTEGYICLCGLEIDCTAWESCVVETIALGQRLGYAWTIFGDIRQEVRGWATEARVVGVKAIELTVLRQA